VLGAEIIGWNVVVELLRRCPPYLRRSLCPRDAEGIGDFEDLPFNGQKSDDVHGPLAAGTFERVELMRSPVFRFVRYDVVGAGEFLQ